MSVSKIKSVWKQKLILKGTKRNFGLGRGVLAEQEVVFSDLNHRGFNSPLFAARLAASEQEMIERNVEVVSKEIKTVGGNRKK